MASGAGCELLDRDFDSFMFWSVESLKCYLRKYGLSVSGSKKDLAARAFAAWDMKLEPVKSDADLNIARTQDYKSALKPVVDGGKPLSDPFSLDRGWIGEKEGMKMWPPTMYFDIVNFLGVNNMDRRLLQDYKEGKAYSYFQTGWIKELFYHRISDESTVCFVKAQCCPSMNVNHTPHTVWVAIKKKEGDVHSAYCTCFAGLGQTCNHVAALLFKLDAAWKCGYTNPACTSTECQWTKPSSTAQLMKPQLVEDIVWDKPSYGKLSRGAFKKSASRRKVFSPQAKPPTGDISELMSKLCIVAPRAVVHKLWPLKEATTSLGKENKSQLPPSVAALASSASDSQVLIRMLSPLLPEAVGFIERETAGQTSNSLWREQRHGRITASVFHSVFTRMQSLESNPSLNCDSLLARVLGYTSPPEHLPALKYGRDMEREAKHKLLDVLREQGHKDVTVEDAGLYVLDSAPYIGASPDAIVTCTCCGITCVEIKCPLSVSGSVPGAGNPQYLKQGKDGVELSAGHQYYSQVQGQLGVTHLSKAFFFVFSRQGHCLVIIPFDQDRWFAMLERLKKFFCQFMAPELVTGHLKLQLEVQASRPVTDCTQDAPEPSSSNPTQQAEDKENQSPSHGSSEHKSQPAIPVTSKGKCSAKVSQKSRQKKGRGVKRKQPQYICLVCAAECLDDCIRPSDFSVCCDRCSMWFHWDCVGVTEDTSQSDWICSDCA